MRGIVYTAEVRRIEGYKELYINGELIWWCKEECDGRD